MSVDSGLVDVVFAPLGAKCKQVRNRALTECQLLGHSSSIDMSLR
jgi:hypothetical protein